MAGYSKLFEVLDKLNTSIASQKVDINYTAIMTSKQ
jgi:hypothetical protein